MLGHYQSEDGIHWVFTCEEKDLGRSMSFDGEEGYFLTVDEYDDIQEKTEEAEKIEELEAEVANLKEVISQAYDSAHDLKYLLGNA